MKKSLVALLALALTLCLAAPALAATELSFSIVAGNDEMPGWKGIVEAFNNSHEDVKIKLEQLPGSWAEYNQKMTTLIAAGSPPDIGRMGVAYMPQYASKGQFKDLTELVERDLNMNDYYASAFEQVKIDDKIYGLPIGVYTLVMYYNKDMFEKNGVEMPSLDWENAWTTEQWLDAVAKLSTGEGRDKTFGFNVSLHPERTACFAYSAGVDFLSEDHATCTMDSEGMKSVYRMMQDLVHKDAFAPTPAQVKTMPTDQMFMSGRLAMIAEGQWMMPALTKKDDYNFGVAPIPGGKTVNFIDQYVIFEGSKNHDLAWEAIKSFIGEEAENVMVDCNLGGIPINKNVAEARKADLFNPLTEEEKDVILASIDYSQAMPFTPDWAELMDKAMKTIDLVGLNQMEAEAAMDKVTEDLNALLAE